MKFPTVLDTFMTEDEPPKEPVTILSDPVYQIPMDTQHLVILARLSSMWGQIEREMDSVLSIILKLSRKDYRLKYERRVISTKLTDLWRELSKEQNSTARPLLVDMHKTASACVDDRNTIMHGMWGWHYLSDELGYKIGCSSVFRDEPFWLSDIYDLHERMVRATISSDRAFCALTTGLPAPENRNRRHIVVSRHYVNEDGSPKMGAPPNWILGW
jgi:hypothetical protein